MSEKPRLPSRRPGQPIDIAVVSLPAFNAFATMAFLDPLRAANYLSGQQLFRWKLLSASPSPRASNTIAFDSEPLDKRALAAADWIVVSASWTPEQLRDAALLRMLKAAAARGAFIAGIDTGAFVLAEAGLTRGRRATVHYEHIDAFQEQYAETTVVEDIFAIDGGLGTCCGGAASIDFALALLAGTTDVSLANAAARYIFHDRIRRPETRQKPEHGEPAGLALPADLTRAIDLMERNLETPLPIPEIAGRLGVSQRTLERLFRAYTRHSAVRYYADARLDRARGLVTQTCLTMTEIALACGFPSPEHFARAYRRRFGLAPRQDRVSGRVPFEYRAWPMHSIRPSD